MPVAHENLAERVLQLILTVRDLPNLKDLANLELRAGRTTGVSYCGFNGSKNYGDRFIIVKT